ncbi:hypothetical protein ANN_24716 [Periplaneta americana]|uniref:Uncharacterized protein n=1 Tax=Periplaneta americana TaxID=6978 RepID=A0ABQ8S021_PERAM|nr:hypothetical protein ANN_24716 [Periplaneta americana]
MLNQSQSKYGRRRNHEVRKVCRKYPHKKIIGEDHNTEYVPTTTIGITFRSKYIPNHFFLFYNRYQIQKYNISNAEIAINLDCTSENTRCPNCTLPHMATDDACSTKQMERNIIDKINDNNISRFDAIQIVTGRETYSTIALTAKDSEKVQQFPILKETSIDLVNTSDDAHAIPTGTTKLDKTHPPYKQTSRQRLVPTTEHTPKRSKRNAEQTPKNPSFNELFIRESQSIH